MPRARVRPRPRCSGVTSIVNYTTERIRIKVTAFEREHWICFGRIAEERAPTRHTCVVSFAPGSIFAFVRWASNGFGTIISRVAVAPGEPCSTLPFVRPRGEILVRIVGWPKVSRVLRAIDQVEMVCVDPADAARDHWRHVHDRLTEPRAPTHRPTRAS